MSHRSLGAYAIISSSTRPLTGRCPFASNSNPTEFLYRLASGVRIILGCLPISTGIIRSLVSTRAKAAASSLIGPAASPRCQQVNELTQLAEAGSFSGVTFPGCRPSFGVGKT